MLADMQGAALTAEQILYEGREKMTPVDAKNGDHGNEISAAGSEGIATSSSSANASNSNLNESLLSNSDNVGGSEQQTSSAHSSISSAGSTRRGDGFQAHGRYFRLSMVASVSVAVAVSSSGVSTVGVISAAQVRSLVVILTCVFAVLQCSFHRFELAAVA